MTKKVLYVSYNGLLEPILPSQTLPYLRGLSKNGFRFILLTFEKREDLRRAGKINLEKTRSDLEKEGIVWKWLLYHKYPEKLSTFLDLSLGFFAALCLILKNNIRIVHVRGVTPGAIALFLSRFLSFKLIFDTRGLLAEEYVGGRLWREKSFIFNLVKLVEKNLLKRSDATILLTEKHYKEHMELPYLKKRNSMVRIIPCCVDLERFKYNTENRKEILKKYNIDANKLFIYPGKIGTFYLIKEMLDFFECASNAIEDLKFLILTRDNISGLKKNIICNNTNGIQFIHPSFDEIPLFLGCADAGIFFINPYKKYASSPIKLGEFLACGRPVIINSGIGDTEELVSNNRVGVVIKDFTKTEYLNKIRELSELLKEGEELKKRCRFTAEKYLSLDMGINHYKGIYTKLNEGIKAR